MSRKRNESTEIRVPLLEGASSSRRRKKKNRTSRGFSRRSDGLSEIRAGEGGGDALGGGARGNLLAGLGGGGCGSNGEGGRRQYFGRSSRRDARETRGGMRHHRWRHRDEGVNVGDDRGARGESARRGGCDDAPAKAAADTLAMAWEYILSFGAVPVDARAGR